MAIRKCTTCGKMTSDSNGRCDYCGEELHDPVSCPKCGSQNIDFDFKEKGNGTSGLAIQSFFGLLPALLFSGANANKYKLIYKCKDCGKKFKLKH